ncbi:NUDIX hydrolase, partial [Streptomyces nanshensis]
MTATTDHGDAGSDSRAASGPSAVTSVRAAALVTTGDGGVLLARTRTASGTSAGAPTGTGTGTGTGIGTGTGTEEPWALPAAEPAAGESLHDAAHRAVTETTGLAPRLGELLTVDWAPGD